MQRRVLPVTALVVALCASLGSALAMAQTPPAQTPGPGAKPAAAPVSSSAAVAKDSRVFELRTYYAEPGKLDALHARFRDHTSRLFQKHGMTIIAYWMPRESPDRIVYVLAYKSKEAADAAWKGFREDPEWVKARTASEANGRLVTKVESIYMDATDYSPMK
jgi:hypothetical protein